MINVYTQEQLESMPIKKANRLRYKMNGLPGKGQRLLSPEEAFELTCDPRFQRAVDLCEKVEGHEKAVRGQTRGILKSIRRYDMQAAEQRKIIDLGLKRARN